MCVVADIGPAQAQRIRALQRAERRATLDEFRPYLVHRDDCSLPRANYCDCGLEALVADAEAAK
jgi:hypothetical protein